MFDLVQLVYKHSLTLIYTSLFHTVIMVTDTSSNKIQYARPQEADRTAEIDGDVGLSREHKARTSWLGI